VCVFSVYAWVVVRSLWRSFRLPVDFDWQPNFSLPSLGGRYCGCVCLCGCLVVCVFFVCVCLCLCWMPHSSETTAREANIFFLLSHCHVSLKATPHKHTHARIHTQFQKQRNHDASKSFVSGRSIEKPISGISSF
jgi:hypothetical protein